MTRRSVTVTSGATSIETYVDGSGTDTGVQIVVLADPATVETLARASTLGVVTVSIAGTDEVGSPGAAMGEASRAPGYLDG